MAEVIFFNLKKDFNDNFMNYEWIESVYKSIYNNDQIRREIIGYNDTTVDLVIHLYESFQFFQKNQNDQQNERKEHIKLMKNEFLEYESRNNVFKLQPCKNTDFDITFNDLLKDLFRKKYDEFNAGDNNSLYGVVNQACKMYEEQYNIEALTNLIKNFKKSTEIIYNKYNDEFLNQIFFESLALENYYYITKEEKNFKVINDNPKIECVYDNITLKIKMQTEIVNYKLEHIIENFMNREKIINWFPFLEEVKIKQKISKTKSIYYVKTLIPIIQDREVYLYGFFNAKLNRNKDGGVLQFMAKSADDLSNKKPEKIFENMFDTSEKPEIQRVYAHNITFDIIFDNNNKIAKINLILDINHGMTFVNIQLVEVICKQLFYQFDEKLKKFFSNQSEENDGNQILNLDRLQRIVSYIK